MNLDSKDKNVCNYFQKFDKTQFDLTGNPLFFENDLIDSENKFREISDCIKNKTPFYVVAGINPFVKPHLGYKFLSNVFDYFLEREHSKGYLIIPEKEMYLMGKTINEKKYTQEFLNLLKNEKKVRVKEDFYVDKSDFMNLTYRKYSLKKLKNAFKIKDEDKIGKYLGVLYAITNYFIPNIENKTKMPTLILANEKHKNFLMYANNLAEDFNFPKISSIILKDLPGKDGYPKMSSSKNKTIISLDNLENDFLRTITSGGKTKLEQKINGGEPADCYALKIGRFFSDKEVISKLMNRCNKGENTCLKCKKEILKEIKK